MSDLIPTFGGSSAVRVHLCWRALRTLGLLRAFSLATLALALALRASLRGLPMWRLLLLLLLLLLIVVLLLQVWRGV